MISSHDLAIPVIACIFPISPQLHLCAESKPSNLRVWLNIANPSGRLIRDGNFVFLLRNQQRHVFSDRGADPHHGERVEDRGPGGHMAGVPSHREESDNEQAQEHRNHNHTPRLDCRDDRVSTAIIANV